MKKSFVFLLLPTLLLYSCYSNEDDYPQPTPKPVYDVIEMNSVNIMDSVTTILLIDSQSFPVPIYFYPITGNPANDKVTCTLSGFPYGLSATADSVTSVLPVTMTPVITANGDTGTYTIHVNIRSVSKGLQSYPVKLHFMPYPNEANCLAGTWNSQAITGTTTCKTTVTPIDSLHHWAIIKNPSCLGDSVSVMAFFSITTGILIPKQTSQGYTIYGRYTDPCPCGFQKLAISIPDTIIHNGDTTHGYLFLSDF